MPKFKRSRGAGYSVKARSFNTATGVRKAARQGAVAALRGLGANVAVRGLQLAPGEFKSVDTLVGRALSTAGQLDLVNGIARGDDIGQRNGREVMMKSVQLDIQCKVNAGTGVDQVARYLLVYDRQTNGTALTAAQVLQVVDTYSPRNLENRKRFKILLDRKMVLNASGEPGSMKMVKFYRRLRHPITFNTGNAGTVADIATGSMYVIGIGSEAAGVTAGHYDGSIRIRYTDV